METDSKKLANQRSFLNLWKANGARGSLVAVTGYGKTTVGVLAIQDMNHHHPERETHVIVPTIVLKKQWEDHIQLWNLINVEVFVINTYIRKSRYTHLLILDELHRYGSRTFSRVFSTAQFNFILGLTATIERQDGNHQLIERYAPVLHTIGLNEALQQGYVSDFNVFNLGVDLTTTEMKEYNEITRLFNHHFSLFGNDFNKVMNALKSRCYRGYLSSISGKSAQEIHAAAARFIQIMHRRKTFLNALPSRLDIVREIFEQLDRKMIVFSETTEFADKVVEAIGPESFAYHTGIKNKREMKNRLNLFKSNREFRLLSAVRSLEEGLDIPDLEVAILVSGNSTKRQYIQRIGRSLRAKPGKTAIIINIFINETKDENWLRARQFANEINVIRVNSVAQIRDYVNPVINGNSVEGKSDQHQYNPFHYSGTDFNPFQYESS